jgi:hypothetical protein
MLDSNARSFSTATRVALAERSVVLEVDPADHSKLRLGSDSSSGLHVVASRFR